MRIAITGGTGFLGRYIIRHLAHQGHRLRCWHRESSDRTGLEEYLELIDWEKGELGDPMATASLVEGVDAVVHAGLYRPSGAGFRAGGEQDFTHFLEVNLMGTARLFEAAYRAEVPRFIFISSCAVHEVILDDRPLDEAHPLWATSHYGAHKAALEKFVHSYGFGQQWPICSLRPTGIYGLAHPPEESRWHDLVGAVLQNQPIQSSRGGKEVHAADVAKAVDVLLNVKENSITGQAFNCYDLYVSEEEVARIAKEITGSTSEISDTNRGPKHQIETGKIRNLGMAFGGRELLKRTIQELVEAHQSS